MLTITKRFRRGVFRISKTTGSKRPGYPEEETQLNNEQLTTINQCFIQAPPPARGAPDTPREKLGHMLKHELRQLHTALRPGGSSYFSMI